MTESLSTAPLDRLLSSAELAEYLSVPVHTLHQWAYRGVGPRRVRVGKHNRYRASDVSAWLETQARG